MSVHDKKAKTDSPRKLLALDGGGIRGVMTLEVLDKIERELRWHPKETFESGIRKTIFWYLENDEWIKEVTSGAYRQWVEKQYANRGGVTRA